MSDMIESLIDKCATVRTASAIEENPALEQVAEAIPVVQHTGESAPDVQALNDEDAENQDNPPPVNVKPEVVRPASVYLSRSRLFRTIAPLPAPAPLLFQACRATGWQPVRSGRATA